MKHILTISLLFFAGVAGAQVKAVEPVQNNVDILKQQGQLFTVQVRRGEPLKIFVVGREEAKLDLSNMKLVVRRLKPMPQKNLEVQQAEGYYLVKEPVGANTDLEVTTEMKGTTETFRFKLPEKKP